MDPRYAMADTYRLLSNLGISSDDFTIEINNCAGSEHAIEICNKWQAIASKVSA
jgi:hypothetical protein